jgi:hypothetical protein
MRRFLFYLLVLFVVISCSCSQPFKLQTKTYNAKPINRKYISNFVDRNSQSSYSIIADGNTLKICDRKTRSLVFSELELPGAVISSYRVVYDYYVICKSQNSNFLVCFSSYNDTLHKLELRKEFEVKTQSSQIIGVLSNDTTIITQSEDKTILYYYKKGNLIKNIKYPRPTIWWLSNYDGFVNIGFDGQDLIFQTDGNHDSIVDEIREKIKEPSPIDNAFFQMTRFYTEYIDLYDGKNLWRIQTQLNSLDNMNIRGPLEIENLEKGINLFLYPYKNGLCMVEINKKDSSKLVLRHVDDRKMYPITGYSGNWWPPDPGGYYLYGYEENNTCRIKCFHLFTKENGNSDTIDFKECDVEPFHDSRENIIDGDYYNPDNDYSSIRDVSFIIFVKDGIYYIPNATNW